MSCSFEGCERPHYAKGLCGSHYNQQLRGLDLTPLAPFKPRRRSEAATAAERLLERSEMQGECRVWMASVRPNGYAKMTFRGEDDYVHRWAYRQWVGPIPEGLTIDHLCGVRTCIEPSHLEVVTRGENTRRACEKTHCIRGHDLAETGVFSGGRRRCRACEKVHAQR